MAGSVSCTSKAKITLLLTFVTFINPLAKVGDPELVQKGRGQVQHRPGGGQLQEGHDEHREAGGRGREICATH